MPSLYIIAGCNGSGKTTASETLLPDLLDCKEFVNADGIAAGISPYNVESVAFEAGRIMLQRIKHLMHERQDFAFETTLASRSYVSLIKDAKELGYEVYLIFFWLPSVEMAIARVHSRVREGGHDIPVDIIERRHGRGIYNLIHLYIPVCDKWSVFNNLRLGPELIAEGKKDVTSIFERSLWNTLIKQS
jgi:predicted ABC-type ATPase